MASSRVIGVDPAVRWAPPENSTRSRRINGDLLYCGRPLPTDPLYQIEDQGLALLRRIPDTSPHYELLHYLLQTAQVKRADAGYGGHRDDGGASQLEAQVELFIDAVIDRIQPQAWKEYAKELERNRDPEYAVYLRLRNKFATK